MSDSDNKPSDQALTELEEKVKILERRANREKKARLLAEKILEEKATELHDLNEKLEHRVIERTCDLKAANEKLESYQAHLEDLVKERTRTIQEQASQLEEALKAQTELNDLQRSFVSMTSHEFRTPLTIIDLAAQKMVRRPEKFDIERLKETAGKIRRAVKRMTGLMESTLAAAKMEDGKIKIAPRECDLREVLSDCCQTQQEMASSHVITLNVDEAPETVYADPNTLEQVFTNLLSNAVKYSPDNPDIFVTVETDGEWVRITFEDQGLGIDEDDIPSMFSRFFRAKTSLGIAGTGIGLNLCKMLMEEHGGDITLQTVAGKGSIFTVLLPAQGVQNQAVHTDN